MTMTGSCKIQISEINKEVDNYNFKQLLYQTKQAFKDTRQQFFVVSHESNLLRAFHDINLTENRVRFETS